MHNRIAEAQAFFQNLYGDELVGLSLAFFDRQKKNGWKQHPRAFNPNERTWPDRADFIFDRSFREDVFFSPNPMNRGRRRKQDALDGLCVFGDADKGLDENAREVLEELDATLVLSGGVTDEGENKYHVYLPLDRPTPPAQVEALNRGLKTLISGDKYDITTLLRIPGTRNHKYDEEPIVEVERWSDTRHTPRRLARKLHVDLDGAEELFDKHLFNEASGVLHKPDDFNHKNSRYHAIRHAIDARNRAYEENGGDTDRSKAMFAIVRESKSARLTIQEAYAFALRSRELCDKQEEDERYRIDSDLMRVWNKVIGSVELSPSAPTKSPKTPKPEPKIKSAKPAPKSQQKGEPFVEEDGWMKADINRILAGDYKIPEPTMIHDPGLKFPLIYPGKSHAIAGESNSGKTMLALYGISLELKRELDSDEKRKRILLIDFEDGAFDNILRLHQIFGCSADVLDEYFEHLHVRPGNTLDAEMIDKAASKDFDLVVVDGVTGSLSMLNYSGRHENEVDDWYREFIQPFTSRGSAVIMVDHVAKPNSNQGNGSQSNQFSIGSQYKKGILTGALYTVEVKDPLKMDKGGHLYVYCAKDRSGWVRKYAVGANSHIFDFRMKYDVDPETGETRLDENGRSKLPDVWLEPADPRAATDYTPTIVPAIDRDKTAGELWDLIQKVGPIKGTPLFNAARNKGFTFSFSEYKQLRDQLVEANYLCLNTDSSYWSKHPTTKDGTSYRGEYWANRESPHPLSREAKTRAKEEGVTPEKARKIREESKRGKKTSVEPDAPDETHKCTDCAAPFNPSEDEGSEWMPEPRCSDCTRAQYEPDATSTTRKKSARTRVLDFSNVRVRASRRTGRTMDS